MLDFHLRLTVGADKFCFPPISIILIPCPDYQIILTVLYTLTAGTETVRHISPSFHLQTHLDISCFLALLFSNISLLHPLMQEVLCLVCCVSFGLLYDI